MTTINLILVFLSNHPFNNSPIIQKLVTDGYFTTFQCPDELSYLLNYFSFDQVNSALSYVINSSYNSFSHMSQLIESIVLNEFEYGISVYSTVQMETALNIFNQHTSHSSINRQALSKLIRHNTNLVHSGRGKYVHVSKLIFICHRRKKATSDLLTAIENLVNLKGTIDGQTAFDLLQNQCASLELTNPYALYGFIEYFNPRYIIHIQDKVGIISYQRKKRIQD